MAFIDVIPEDARMDKENSVTMSARLAPVGKGKDGKGKRAITFQVFIGNKILEQLIDYQRLPWSNALVHKLVVRVGTGEDAGQMMIASSPAGNIQLKTRDTDKPTGRWFSVKNFPGIQVMEKQEVDFKILPGEKGNVLHITKYTTGEVSVADIRASDVAGIAQKDSVAPKAVEKESANVNPPPPPPPPPLPKHEKIDIRAASAAMSRAAKKS